MQPSLLVVDLQHPDPPDEDALALTFFEDDPVICGKLSGLALPREQQAPLTLLEAADPAVGGKLSGLVLPREPRAPPIPDWSSDEVESIPSIEGNFQEDHAAPEDAASAGAPRELKLEGGDGTGGQVSPQVARIKRSIASLGFLRAASLDGFFGAEGSVCSAPPHAAPASDAEAGRTPRFASQHSDVYPEHSVASRVSSLATSSRNGMIAVFSRVSRRCNVARLQRETHHVTTVVFPLVVCITSAALCALAFCAIPTSNPLEKSSDSQWWHCPLSCSIMWAPMSTAYLWELLQEFMYHPWEKSISTTSFFSIYACFTSFMVAAMATTMELWVNPAPLNGAISSLSAQVGAFANVFFCLVPQLARECSLDLGEEELAEQRRTLRAIQKQALHVIGFGSLSAIVVMATLLWCCFLTWLDLPYVNILGLSCLRIVLCYSCEHIALMFGGEAGIVGLNLALISSGAANIISVGLSSSWGYTLALVFVDMLFIAKSVLGLASLEVKGVNVSGFILDPLYYLKAAWVQRSIFSAPHMSNTMMLSLYQRELSYAIALQVGEVVVPLAYTVCWIVVWAGPNRHAFSGIGTSDFGLKPPEDPWMFIAMSAVLVVTNHTTVEVLKVLLRRLCKIDLEQEAGKLFHVYGRILIIQTVWVIVTAFCMTMIQCGLDYSLKYAYLKGPREN